MSAPPEALAGASALLFAGSHIATKRGVQQTSVVAGLLTSLTTGTIVLAVAVALDPPSGLSLAPVLVLAASGLLAPATARAGALMGVDRLGPSVSVPVQSSIYPLCAIAGGVLLFHDEVRPPLLAGTVAIVAGIWLLARRERADRAREVPRRRWRLRSGLIFPVIAGLGYGAADLVRKLGVEGLHSPAAAAFIAAAAAVVVWGLVAAGVPAVRRRVRFGGTTGWFFASGVLSALALLSQFHALDRADVSVISPIVAAQPLAVFVLSLFFLRGLERLTIRKLLGATAVVAGTVLVSV